MAFRGPLGAGKTCFAKGIARGLGVEDEVTSPTYTIVSEYEAKTKQKNNGELSGKLYHIDAYRLRGDDDFTAMGGEEIIFGTGISMIEWSERISDSIPQSAFKVDIEILENGDRRIDIYRGAFK